jgi:hypothetical protein
MYRTALKIFEMYRTAVPPALQLSSLLFSTHIFFAGFAALSLANGLSRLDRIASAKMDSYG